MPSVFWMDVMRYSMSKMKRETMGEEKERCYDIVIGLSVLSDQINHLL